MDFSRQKVLILIHLICGVLLNTEARNECESNPCSNGATCVDGPYGYYTCLCTGSWHGKNCDIELTSHYPCESGNFYNYTGEIFSNNYPNALPNRLRCFLLIRIHGAETINITFNMFDVEEDRDAVYFGYGYEIATDNSYDAAWTNGAKQPPDVFTLNGSAAWIMVETNKIIQSQGYRLSISADGNDCIDRQCPVGICDDLIRDYTCPCYLTCHNEGVCNLHGGCDCPQNVSTGVNCEFVLCVVPDYPAHLIEAGMPTDATSCYPHALILEDGTCLFECEVGYTLVGDPTARCGADRLLSPLPTCHVACDIQTSDEFLISTEGNCLGMETIIAGQTCGFECQVGYRLIGESSVTCGSEGGLLSLPSCQEIHCDISALPSNLMSTSAICNDWSSIEYGTTCEFHCQTGYTLMGMAELSCNAEGILTGDLPTCEEMSNDEDSSTESYGVDDSGDDDHMDGDVEDIDSGDEMAVLTTMASTKNSTPTLRKDEGGFLELTTLEVIVIAGGILGFIVVINLVIVMVCCRPSSCKFQDGRDNMQPLQSISAPPTTVEPDRYVATTVGPNAGLAEPDHEPPCEDGFKFPVDRLQGLHEPKNLIDGGSFGRIYRVEAVGIMDGQDRTTVAVKMLRDSATDHEKNNFLNELQIMKDIPCHPSIIRLLGYSTGEGGSTYVIMEYCPNKSLHHYLSKLAKENRQGSANVSSEELLRFGVEIATAMEHLAQQKIVHRDLATRNVLLGSRLDCKVADFGLARHVDDDEEYIMMSRGRVPYRWIAPESLRHDVYSTKSDVWSFAVLMWEILTLGARPYTGMASHQVKLAVEMGYRLPKPDHCSQSLYNLMLECWKQDPIDRPSFSDIRVRLEIMLTTASTNIVMDDFDGTDYEYMTVAGLVDDHTDGDPPQDDMVAHLNFDTRRLYKV